MEKFSRKNWMLLLLFGAIGQIAWAVENMFFNLFVYQEVFSSLETVTLMVQLSGITATVVTLIAGTLSDKVGNRKSFISYGYIIWGVTVALFGCISPAAMEKLFGLQGADAIKAALVLVVVGDCVMTLFGSSANDAAFNAWVTDTTKPEFRGRVESILSILPLVSMLVVVGGFGTIADMLGSFRLVFMGLGLIIVACGFAGIFLFEDAPTLQKSGGFADIIYGFRPSVIKKNAPFYVTLAAVAMFGIAVQVFMPYLIIFMSRVLSFDVLQYSAVFAIAILAGAGVNVYLGKVSDKMSKSRLLYLAAALLSAGLFVMYFASAISVDKKLVLMLVFGFGGFVMICGNIFSTALTGSILRDNTPEGSAGKMQGVRMVASVLIPMLIGPSIGNSINKFMAGGKELEDAGTDILTTSYLPAREIFLVAAIASLVVLAIIPFITKAERKSK